MTTTLSSRRQRYTLNMVPNLSLDTIKAHLEILCWFQINSRNTLRIPDPRPIQAPRNRDMEAFRVIRAPIMCTRRTGAKITRGRIERRLIEAFQGAIGRVQ